MILSAVTQISHRPYGQIVITLFLSFLAPYGDCQRLESLFHDANVLRFFEYTKFINDYLE